LPVARCGASLKEASRSCQGGSSPVARKEYGDGNAIRVDTQARRPVGS
jgi:hypothetical protein